MSRRFLLAAVLTGWACSTQAQLGEINLLTDLGSPFPPGCLSISLPDQPRSNDSILVDTEVPMPSTANPNSRDEAVNVLIWRVACADDDFSVVLVRMEQVSNGDPVIVPNLFADSGNVEVPDHQAQLLEIPAAGFVGASGNIVTQAGTTWMLAVDPIAISDFNDPNPQASFFPEDYNDVMTLELNWGAYSSASIEGVLFQLLEFDPLLDPPQFDQPVLNGRYSGQWTRVGAERQGLVLQIAERTDSTNFVFAIFFTYLDGQPIWVAGNSTPDLAEPGPVTIDMATLENGAFIVDPDQPARDDVTASDAGSITIRVIDCNNIRVDYDFSALGQGSGSMDLERLVRIAGYDCNPWE